MIFAAPPTRATANGAPGLAITHRLAWTARHDRQHQYQKTARRSAWDAALKEAIANWHINRAEVQLLWAKHENELPEPARSAVNRALEKITACEQAMAQTRPRSVVTAQKLLAVVTEIMAYGHHEPEGTLADQTHCLEIIRNVRDALGYLDDAPLRPVAEVADEAVTVQ